MRLFFEKNQKIGLFLSRFYAFFRVFMVKNTVQHGTIIKISLPYFQSAICNRTLSEAQSLLQKSAIHYPLPKKKRDCQ
jgi:hypothetical protein